MFQTEIKKTGKQTKFYTTALRSSLCDYSDTYTLVKGTSTIGRAGADATAIKGNKRNKQVTLKNCTTFINCISQKNNTQVDNAVYLDILIPKYNLIE